MSKKIQVKFFSIPLCGDCELEEELNRFLQTRQIISFDKGLADQAWNFCITYVGTGANSSSSDAKNSAEASTEKKKGMKDYKEELTAVQYALYLKLNRLRNQISEQRKIFKPLIFHNEELAQMSISRCSTLEEMQKIPGVGKKKAQEYGEIFLRMIAEFEVDEADAIAAEQEKLSRAVEDESKKTPEENQASNEA